MAYSKLFSFLYVTIAQLEPRPPHGRVFYITQLDTHPLGLVWSSDQVVAEASSYTTHNKQKKRTSMPSARFEPAIPAIGPPQTNAFVALGQRDRPERNFVRLYKDL